MVAKHKPHLFRLSTLASCICMSVYAQADSEDSSTIERINITSQRVEANNLDTPYSVAQVTIEDVRQQMLRSVPELLETTAGVLVQKTGYGQGSPYVRGFTGFRNLFLIDGIRLNNSIFREGPNQYWNTVDPFSIARIELVKGPNSALYGADAIGGTLQVLSRSLLYSDRRESELDYFVRTASAESSTIARTSWQMNTASSAFYVGGTFKDFGDLKRGNGLEQPATGYDEYNFDAKARFAINQDWDMTLATFLTRQDDVPRTHKTIDGTSFAGSDIGNEIQRNLDHRRRLSYARLDGSNITDWLESASFTLSWHDQEESRSRIRSRNRYDVQGIDTETLGIQAQFTSRIDSHTLVYGLEYYLDTVDSFSTSNPIQGPVADDADYHWFGLYLQDNIQLSERLKLLAGVRFNYMEASADKISDPNSDAVLTLDENWDAIVGNLMLNYRLSEEQSVYTGLAQAFRAPNLSDLTRFDSARSNEFEIPSVNLDAEHYLTYSLGYKYHDDRWSADISAYYTWVDDQIQRIPTGAQNEEGEFEITKENIGDGYFSGMELSVEYRATESITIVANYATIGGKLETFPTSERILVEEYASRLMPDTLNVGIFYAPEGSPWWMNVQFTAAEAADRLSTRDSGDTERIPPGGTPGYGVIHARAGYQLSDSLTLGIGVENLFDKDYRIHGSGQNEAGRNLMFTLSGTL